jgi:hypothetical protein
MGVRSKIVLVSIQYRIKKLGTSKIVANGLSNVDSDKTDD